MLKGKRKVAEVITISDQSNGVDVDADSDLDCPGWLPDGWETVSRRRKNNNQDISFYYPCPQCSGITLRSQAEVLRHCIFLCEDAPLKSQEFSRNVKDATRKHPRLVQQENQSPPEKDRQISGSSAKEGQLGGNGLFDSIPHGWTIEIRRGPVEHGKMYKFYVDPTKEFRFSSKEEVQYYLKEGKPLYPDPKESLCCDTKGEENMISEMTFSPEGLPHGWIKEARYRHYRHYVKYYKNGIRKDAYYTNLESGTEFRSIKDVERYLFGNTPKQARVPRRRSITKLYSFEGSAEMPAYLARRFSSKRGYASKKLINDDVEDDDDDDDDDDNDGDGANDDKNDGKIDS